MSTITVQTKGVDMTDAIHAYAEEKITSLEKFFEEGIIRADVICGMDNSHHQKGKIYFAEVTLYLPKKHSIHVQKESEDLYKAIDKVKDHCKVELEKIKGKMTAKDQEEIREQKAYHVDEE